MVEHSLSGFRLGSVVLLGCSFCSVVRQPVSIRDGGASAVALPGVLVVWGPAFGQFAGFHFSPELLWFQH